MNGRKAEVRCENARRNRLAVRGYSLGGLPNPVKNKMVRFFAGNPQAIKPASVAEVGLSFRNSTQVYVRSGLRGRGAGYA